MTASVPIPDERCSTCGGTGHIEQEHQIGTPGSGGWFTCPDCRPLPVQRIEFCGHTDEEGCTGHGDF